MGDLITCPWGAAGAAGVAGAAGAAGAAAAGAATTGSGTYATGWGAGTDLTMRTLPSPSLISSSAIPDSATRSIRVLSFLRSIQTFPCHFTVADNSPQRKKIVIKNENGMRRLSARQRVAQGGFIAIRAQSGDHPDGQVGQIGVMTERLSLVNIGYMHFDERDGDRSQSIAQRDAGMGIGPGINEDVIGAVAARAMDAIHQRAFVIALKRRASCAMVGRH